MREYNFRPDKRLGQDFLIDRNIVDKIIHAAGITNKDVVVEIGAGVGNITKDVATIAKRLIGVEFDKRLFDILSETLRGYKNCELIREDILKFDFKPYAKEGKLKVIGNVPYYITTPILERIIENKDYIKDALLMVQKEVALRMVAKGPSKSYSPITCYVQYYTKPEFKGSVKSTSFFPKPEVDSALIYLKILDEPSVKVTDEKIFFKIVRSAFGQRRKMILSSLGNKKTLGLDKDQVRKMLTKSGIRPERRPEELSLEEFARIANEFTKN